MATVARIDEKGLLDRLAGGDRVAFGTVFDRFYARLCVFANRYVHDKETSKDIVNDVFVKFWSAPKRFEQLDHVLSSLYLATKNTALNHQQAQLRAMRRNYEFQAERGDEDSFYLAEISRVETLHELYQAISNLPERAGRIIRETYIEGRSNQEVADEMGISLQTLRNQKSRALSILRGQLRKESFGLLVAGAFVLCQHPL